MKRKSRRFIPSKRAEFLVPALLVLLTLGLVATLAIVLLSILGLTPGF